MSITFEEPPAEEVQSGKGRKVYEGLLEASRAPNRWCKIDDVSFSNKSVAQNCITNLKKKAAPRTDCSWDQWDILLRWQSIGGDADKRGVFVFARFVTEGRD